MQSFLELGVSARVAQALAERDIHAPFRIQGLVLPDALAGRDVLAKSPTGSGKTLAFAVPMVERLKGSEARPSGLILVPTRELAAQVTAEIGTIAPAHDLRVAAVYGGISIGSQAKASRDAHILVATPGRLQDLIERRIVSLDGVRILVLDEADRMLDMGFQPQVDRIVARLPKERQTMFFSATLDGKVGELAQAYTTNAGRYEAELTIDQQQGEIDHQFLPVTADNKVETLAGLLAQERGLALVFVRTKRGADRLVQKLARHDVIGGRDARRHEPEPARAGAEALRERHGQGARRHRRRRPRPRPRRHHARDQLRPAGGAHRVRPPRRPHGPRRAQRHGRHARPPGAAGRGQPRGADARAHRDVRQPGHDGRPAPPRLPVEAAQLQVGPVPAPPQDLAQSFWASPPRDARHGCARGYSHPPDRFRPWTPRPAPTSPTRRSPRQGEQRIRWVAKHSPVLNRLARERLSDGALRGRRVAVVVHLEAKTAYLATLLADAGAQVVASGSNPGSTQDAICAALVARGIEVHARHGATRDEFDADLLAVADTEPEIVVDDGAELTARIVEHRPEVAAGLAGRDRGDDDGRRAAAGDGGAPAS